MAAAFETRTKPAWCDDHITAIFATSGLAPLEPFVSPTAFRLTRCTSCGCEAHYRLEYVLGQNTAGIGTCRACFWRAWGADQRRALKGFVDFLPVPVAAVQAHAEANGYEYLGPLTDPPLPHDPHRVRCRGHCGRITAEREGDIGFGCPCRQNPRREMQTSTSASPTGEKRVKALLKNSGLPALEWWDHDTNDPVAWDTSTVRARREVAWRCPECELRFHARVLDMTASPSCPDCSAKRQAAWASELARWKLTPVSSVPELASAWADDIPSSEVMVAANGVHRFRCAQGHHPRITPLSFLRHGCPSCRGNATRSERLERVELAPETHSMNREVASQWHPDKNSPLRLETISASSRRTVWWKDWECGHEWQATPAHRAQWFPNTSRKQTGPAAKRPQASATAWRCGCSVLACPASAVPA